MEYIIKNGSNRNIEGYELAENERMSIGNYWKISVNITKLKE